MNTNHERRLISARNIFHLRSAGMADADPMSIGGYAAVYNVYSSDPGLGFREILKPGAFRNVVAQRQDVCALFNHDANLILGRTTSGTLQLADESKGLRFVCNLPSSDLGRRVLESIRRGDVNGCSFSFTLGDGDDSWDTRSLDDINADQEKMNDMSQLAMDADLYGDDFDDDDDRARRSRAPMYAPPGGAIIRTIRNVTTLHDVSPVTYPAYGGTSVAARAMQSLPQSCPQEFRARIEELRNKVLALPTTQERRRRLLDLA
jgi:HK97 family phage prohead protease